MNNVCYDSAALQHFHACSSNIRGLPADSCNVNPLLAFLAYFTTVVYGIFLALWTLYAKNCPALTSANYLALKLIPSELP